jgi:hypothetical protein
MTKFTSLFIALVIAISPPVYAKVYTGGRMADMKPSSCQYEAGDVLLSTSALEALACTEEELRDVTRCFHWPYDRTTRRHLPREASVIRKRMLKSKDDLGDVLRVMDRRKVTWKTFVCKRNSKVWYEPRWQRLKGR